MRKLHEYELKPGQRNVFSLPIDGKIVGVGVNNNTPHLLMTGDPQNGKETREFVLVGRNGTLPDGDEVGVCNANGRFFVVVEV